MSFQTKRGHRKDSLPSLHFCIFVPVMVPDLSSSDPSGYGGYCGLGPTGDSDIPPPTFVEKTTCVSERPGNSDTPLLLLCYLWSDKVLLVLQITGRLRGRHTRVPCDAELPRVTPVSNIFNFLFFERGSFCKGWERGEGGGGLLVPVKNGPSKVPCPPGQE